MVKFNDVVDTKNNLSPHQLSIIKFENKNSYRLKELIYEDKLDENKGIDVGSVNYLEASPKIFLRTDVLSPDSFIPVYNFDSLQYINPHSFVQMNLKKGDIIITKDSNIGESAILQKDMPDAMICGAMYRLPIKKHSKYIFAMLKSEVFKNQLDLLVPRGATIRHAGKKFLECKIPFPQQESEITEIENIVNKIIDVESQILTNEENIFKLLDGELSKTDMSRYLSPKISLNEVLSSKRLDESFYDPTLKRILYTIKNYPKGCRYLKDYGLKTKRGQNLQVSQIGSSIYYHGKRDNLYTLIKPTNFSDFGTVSRYQYIGNKLPLARLEPGDIIFSAEGTIGKCVLFSEQGSKFITNIHGIILYGQKDIDICSFICCVLRYYRRINLYDYLSVGGQGGSLAPKLLEELPIPNIPDDIMKKIARLYYSHDMDGDEAKIETMGICQLDQYNKRLKERLKIKIEKIKNETADQ